MFLDKNVQETEPKKKVTLHSFMLGVVLLLSH